jgi:type VI secretion system protein ImpK
MKLNHWNMIIALRLEISRLLERTLAVESTRLGERATTLLVDPTILAKLNAELRTKLDALRDNLNRELTENETYLVMFPLVLLCDEMVMCRLSKAQQTSWSLLQSELFQINYGGDVFYDFVDERLDKPDTPPIVFEVLYFCLAAGFVGKFGESGSKVQRYRTLLSEQLAASTAPLAERKRRRRLPRTERGDRASRRTPTKREPGERTEKPIETDQRTEPPRRVDWRGLSPYGVALAMLTAVAVAVLLFTNL